VAYANLADIELILPPEEDMPDSGGRAESNLLTALEESTDLVIGYLDREFTEDDLDLDDVPDDVPDAVRRVVARVALRGFLDEPSNPGAESEVELMGPFSHTLNWSKESQARSFYLTDSDKMRLDRFRLQPVLGAANFPMQGACGIDWYG
jgi:hypothetical protein